MSTATKRKASKLQQRRKLLELLFTPGALALNDPKVMSGAWR